MKFKNLVCCSCDAEITLDEYYYNINGENYCEDCGKDELNSMYRYQADYSDADYEQGYDMKRLNQKLEGS